ncbi:MAG: M48 family metallopeptidase [Elusimicrobia bacterium]|nr:M48 family metallopeptidase [Elusimicrobiota bacterium]
MNIYDQQKSNRRQTVAIVFVFLIFFAFLGLGFDGLILRRRVPLFNSLPSDYYSETENGGFVGIKSAEKYDFPIGTAVALLAAFIIVISSAAGGPKMVLRSTSAREANPAVPLENQFINVVEEMSLAAGIPKPKVYIVPDADPNAFATGFSPQKSYVAATAGLLQSLNREELQGVVAHEISHVKNYDVRLMTMVAALAGAIALLSNFMFRTRSSGRALSSGSSGSGRKSGGGGGGILVILWFVLIILAPIISRLMAMAISRKREYLADASGAEITRNPSALISALTKIHNAVAPTRSINGVGVAHMCIDDPRGNAFDNKEGFFADLFSTHPPMAKRINALKAMAYQNSGV